MALLDLVDKITDGIEKGKFVIGIFIDLQKAFDTIDFEILFKKLDCYGIRGVALNWLKSYVTDRQQYVYLNNATSHYENVLYGVPQGSILDPLLFILYINDLHNCSSILDPFIYADDTNLLATANSWSEIVTTINDELQKISQWFMANKLSVN